MPLSARRATRRPITARAVGLPTRLLASCLDALLPSALVLTFSLAGWIRLDVFLPHRELLLLDHALLLLYDSPGAVISAPLWWMALWSLMSLIGLTTVQTTPGKWLVGLSVRRANGGRASGSQALARVAAAWTVPLTLGLAYLWVAVNPDRRGWHDLLSRTFVVSDTARSVSQLAPRRPEPRLLAASADRDASQGRDLDRG